MTDDVMARVGGRGCGGAVAFLWGVGRFVRADRFRWGWIVSGFVEGLLYGGGVVVIVVVFGGRGWEAVVVGGVGAGAVGASSAHLAVAVAGVGASSPRGPSRHGGSRACRGACPGLGRRRPRRRNPRPRRRPRVPSWTSRRVQATGQALGSVVAVVHQSPRGPRRRAPCAPGPRPRGGAGRVVGAPCARWWPSRRCGGQCGFRWQTWCGEYPDRVGTWAQVDHPSAVRAGDGGDAAQQASGARSPSAGPVARGVLPGAAPDSPSARMRPTRGAGPPGDTRPGR